jgi:serine O-acetyltransferase
VLDASVHRAGRAGKITSGRCPNLSRVTTSDPVATRTFSELVFSDLARYRPGEKPGWLRVLARCVFLPGMIASVILRAQQCLNRSGRVRLATLLRTVSTVVLSADFGPGMTIGTGLMMPHPIGVNIGYGLRIGDNVTFAAGVTCAARYYDRTGPQDFATICDGAIIGAHAVLVGGVRIGENAMVGANSVVLSDVPDNAVVMGVPARRIGTRDEDPGPGTA